MLVTASSASRWENFQEYSTNAGVSQVFIIVPTLFTLCTNYLSDNAICKTASANNLEMDEPALEEKSSIKMLELYF